MTTDNAKRFNEGKVDYTLLPTDALAEEAKIWQSGEIVYGRFNWTKLWGDKTNDVVLASAWRHLLAIQNGEIIDKDSGGFHAACVRANMAMLIRYYGNQGITTDFAKMMELAHARKSNHK